MNAYPDSLWNFQPPPNGFHVLGYVMAFTGPASNPLGFQLVLSNQNTTILQEQPRLNPITLMSGPPPPNTDGPLIADATISENLAGTAANPAGAGSFTSVGGGFSARGCKFRTSVRTSKALCRRAATLHSRTRTCNGATSRK